MIFFEKWVWRQLIQTSDSYDVYNLSGEIKSGLCSIVKYSSQKNLKPTSEKTGTEKAIIQSKSFLFSSVAAIYYVPHISQPIRLSASYFHPRDTLTPIIFPYALWREAIMDW